MSAEPSTEQAIKALQAQNAQFQELFMNLAKGQQDLKALILKEKKKKKKKKKKTVLFNMGHMFGFIMECVPKSASGVEQRCPLFLLLLLFPNQGL